jgi:SnoaL-like domain
MILLYLDVEIFFRETLDYSYLNYLNTWYLGVEVNFKSGEGQIMATQGRAEEPRAMDGRSVVRRLYDSFAAWDMEAVAGLLSDDVVFHVPGTGANASDHRGREWVFAFLEQAARLTGGTLRIRLHDELVGDEHAAAALGGTCLLRSPRLGNSA